MPEVQQYTDKILLLHELKDALMYLSKHGSSGLRVLLTGLFTRVDHLIDVVDGEDEERCQSCCFRAMIREADLTKGNANE